MYLGDIYTVSVNLAGLPGISVPCGEDKDGLPVGLQILGQTFDEKKIIRAAYSFEKYRLENMSLKCDDIVDATAGKEA
jgi:aspartyl-tRNA(Asn)/glutamyl-tRNA(Gln) amidotransferase subunit A